MRSTEFTPFTRVQISERERQDAQILVLLPLAGAVPRHFVGAVLQPPPDLGIPSGARILHAPLHSPGHASTRRI